jgi:hypothetical protein
MPANALATVLASTLTQSRKKLIMASAKSCALVAWFMANNRVDTEPGGYNITNPLITSRNPNITSMEYYDTLPVNQTDEFDTVEYRWSRVVGTMIASDQEESENDGPAQIFKIVKAKMMVLEESIKEKFSDYMYGAGAGTDPYGLASAIPDDPTVGSFGGISRATESQWRTSAYNFAGSLDSTNIEEAFDDVLLDLTLKGERPNIIIVGTNIWRLYKAAVRDKMVFSITETANGKRMADLGFGGISHENVTILHDEDCPVSRAYFINDKYLRLHLLKGHNMKIKELNSPWNMDASGQRVIWQGQLCLWKAYRTHAVLIN